MLQSGNTTLIMHNSRKTNEVQYLCRPSLTWENIHVRTMTMIMYKLKVDITVGHAASAASSSTVRPLDRDSED